MAASFPSKILVYLANELKVVSARILAIEFSPAGHAMHFYDGNNAKNLTEAILSINVNSGCGSREIVNKLNTEFVKNVKKLLEQ